jgi:serine/threonine protein kinase
VLKLLAFFESKGSYYILLELMKTNLFDVLYKSELSEPQIVFIFNKVCLAIKYLHDKQLIHRDIKPENILLDERMNVKLCDFDFCAPCNRREYRTTVCGTREYLPPEVLGGSPQTSKVDIWCLGILFFEMLHKRVPFLFKYDDPHFGLSTTQPIPFSERLNPAARELIEKCLKVDPGQRPSIDEVLASAVFRNLPM